MFETFQGENADEVWRRIAGRFCGGHDLREQPSRAGPTREIMHAAITVNNPRERWVVSRSPPLNVAFAIAEVVWIMAGRNDLPFLHFWNKQYAKRAGATSPLHGAYGFRLRKHFMLDQLQRAYSTLRGNPDSRQVVLQIWDAQCDMPAEDGEPVSTDIPCNIVSMLKIRNSKLEWTQILRSNDLFLGLPHNLVQFTYLQEMLAGWLGIEPGTYNQISDSLHLYSENEQSVQQSAVAVVAPSNTDLISIPKDASEAAFAELARRAEGLTQGGLSEIELRRISRWPDAPIGFSNMLLVLGAEAARRAQFPQLSTEIMSGCNNPLFSHLWQRWRDRIGARSE